MEFDAATLKGFSIIAGLVALALLVVLPLVDFVLRHIGKTFNIPALATI